VVLKPIFEADFLPCSYGFRTKRRAQDTIAEIHMLGSNGYQWVLGADITACFDEISHPALMARVRRRIKDRRVLGLVKAFLKAGVLSEDGITRDTKTGTPQGGILSPLLANIACRCWTSTSLRPGRPTCPPGLTGARRRRHGLATYRIVRYADDFVVMVVAAGRKTITRQGTNNPLKDLLRQLNSVLRGWTNYFRHAVAKQTFSDVQDYTWRRVMGWLRRKYHRSDWKQIRRHLGGWWPPGRRDRTVRHPNRPVTRYRYRGTAIATPWTPRQATTTLVG
jgi:RNA-directed DNA polymerase